MRFAMHTGLFNQRDAVPVTDCSRMATLPPGLPGQRQAGGAHLGPAGGAARVAQAAAG